MISSLLCASAVWAYTFAGATEFRYGVDVTFDGYLPVFGGNQGRVDVNLVLLVKPIAGSEAGTFAVESSLEDAKISFNSDPLPLAISDFERFIPKSKSVFFSGGVLKSTTTPKVELPFRLPGLDVEQFAAITFIPIQFPEKPGDLWTYTSSFSGNPLRTQVRVLSETEKLATFSITRDQTLESFEDENQDLVSEKEKATSVVKTKGIGSGKLEFDRVSGSIETYSMKFFTQSEVTPIAGGESKTRKLNVSFLVKRLHPSKAGVVKDGGKLK
jgi:hypothetical protein